MKFSRIRVIKDFNFVSTNVVPKSSQAAHSLSVDNKSANEKSKMFGRFRLLGIRSEDKEHEFIDDCLFQSGKEWEDVHHLYVNGSKTIDNEGEGCKKNKYLDEFGGIPLEFRSDVIDAKDIYCNFRFNLAQAEFSTVLMLKVDVEEYSSFRLFSSHLPNAQGSMVPSYCFLKMNFVDAHNKVRLVKYLNLHDLFAKTDAGRDTFFNKYFCFISDLRSLLQLKSMNVRSPDQHYVLRCQLEVSRIILNTENNKISSGISYSSAIKIQSVAEKSLPETRPLSSSNTILQTTASATFNLADAFTIQIDLFGPRHQMLIETKRSILCRKSYFFDKLVKSETKEGLSGCLQIPQFDVEAVKFVFKFLLRLENKSLLKDQDLNLGFESKLVQKPDIEFSVKILQMAHCYGLVELVDLCVYSIVFQHNQFFTVRSALQVYTQGYLMGIGDLVFRSLQFLTRNKHLLIAEDGAKELVNATRHLHHKGVAILFQEIFTSTT